MCEVHRIIKTWSGQVNIYTWPRIPSVVFVFCSTQVVRNMTVTQEIPTAAYRKHTSRLILISIRADDYHRYWSSSNDIGDFRWVALPLTARLWKGSVKCYLCFFGVSIVEVFYDWFLVIGKSFSTHGIYYIQDSRTLLRVAKWFYYIFIWHLHCLCIFAYGMLLIYKIFCDL